MATFLITSSAELDFGDRDSLRSPYGPSLSEGFSGS